MNPEDPDLLRSLPRHQVPPAWLEESIVRELKARGRIRQTPAARRWIAVAGALAASVILFVAGLAAGGYLKRPSAATATDPTFILLLYQDAGYLVPGPEGSEERVAEYRDWARDLGARGRFVGGEKLKDAAETLPPGEGSPPREPGPGILAGYFIIAASDPPEAIAIARDCPHLRYGGRIVVREIDPT